MLIIALGASLCAAGGFAEEEAVKEIASSIAIGATINDGNTDNSLGNVSLTLDHKPSDKKASRLAIDWAYGETDSVKTTEKGKVAAEHKYIVTDRSYITLNASAEYDDIADVDYRWLASPGVGYYLMKDDAASLFVEAGVGVLGEKKGDIDQGEKIVFRAAERYERVTEMNAKYWQSVEYIPHIDDADIYILNAEIGVEAPVSEKLNIRLAVKDTYDSNPAAGLKHNDVTFIAALAYTLL